MSDAWAVRSQTSCALCTQGAAVATTLTLAFQAWAVTGRLLYGTKAPRMPVSLDRCPDAGHVLAANLTMTTNQAATSVFPVYRLSSYWGGLLSALATVVLGLVISHLTGGRRNVKRHVPLTSDVFVRIWRKAKMLVDADLEEQELSRCEDNPVQVFTIEDKPDIYRTKL
ncbi:hypothetical protein V5799_028369 [Amblyomma americanum]|uniref:Uncharacterized protein n=1 Tax=Amblyomma americanum TaxID=6943 RepID=A0AAQ4DD25_AMBAM